MRRLRGLISVWTILLLVAVAGAVYLVMEPVAVFGVDGGALAESLEDEAPDDWENAECTEQARVWECRIELDPGSGFGAAYAVDVDDEGCWIARSIPYEGQPPADAQVRSACIDILDVTGVSRYLDLG